MRLDNYRFSHGKESTLGLFFIDGLFSCYTLEDQHQNEKVYGETRIPSGSYNIGLRTEGGHNARYAKKYGATHEGMLQILDVPGFEYILIHVGNDDDDTHGCLLVGDTANNNQVKGGFIGDSGNAYVRIYSQILEAIKKGEPCTIHIHNDIC